MPSPAGVSAPESDRPTVHVGPSIFCGEELAGLAQPAGVVGDGTPRRSPRSSGSRAGERVREQALAPESVF